MPGIFLSYRRSDSAGWAGRLHDSLKRLLPSTPLFMDVEDIPPGVDFERVLGDGVARCDLLITLIGPQWLDARDANGQRRLDSPQDHTRIEIEAALSRDIRVIPVLVGGARQPTAAELPESLRPLAKRQNFELSDRAWEEGCRRLADAIGQAIAAPDVVPLAPGRSKRVMVVGLALSAIAVAIAVLMGLRAYNARGRQSVPPSRPIQNSASAPRSVEKPPQTPSPEEPREAEIIYEENIDRPDATWDLNVLRVGTSDYHACDDPCLRRSDCKSFVYVKPGVREADALCILKSELPRAVLNQPCCITGVVKARAFNP